MCFNFLTVKKSGSFILRDLELESLFPRVLLLHCDKRIDMRFRKPTKHKGVLVWDSFYKFKFNE